MTTSVKPGQLLGNVDNFYEFNDTIWNILKYSETLDSALDRTPEKTGGSKAQSNVTAMCGTLAELLYLDFVPLRTIFSISRFLSNQPFKPNLSTFWCSGETGGHEGVWLGSISLHPRGSRLLGPKDGRAWACAATAETATEAAHLQLWAAGGAQPGMTAGGKNRIEHQQHMLG